MRKRIKPIKRTKPRELTQPERDKGRDKNYWKMSARDQWADDKRLGILDWDGK